MMMVKFPSIVYKDVYCVRLSSKSKGCFNISTLNLFLISLTKIQNEKKLHLDTWYSNSFSLEILKTFFNNDTAYCAYCGPNSRPLQQCTNRSYWLLYSSGCFRIHVSISTISQKPILPISIEQFLGWRIILFRGPN